MRKYFRRISGEYAPPQAFIARSVTSRPVKTFLGIFERDGKRVTVSPEDAEKLDKKIRKDETEYRNKIVIRREGEAILPVEVRITFKNGEIVNEHWDGAYRWVKYEFLRRSEVAKVEVDPGHKLALDVNFVNNSWAAEPDVRPMFKWSSTLLFWIQNVLHVASMVA